MPVTQFPGLNLHTLLICDWSTQRISEDVRFGFLLTLGCADLKTQALTFGRLGRGSDDLCHFYACRS